MLKHIITNSKAGEPLRRTLPFILMMFLTIAGASFITNAKAVYIIDDGQTRTTVEHSSSSPSVILRDAGISVDQTDRITTELNEEGITEIKIVPSCAVSIEYLGSTLHTRAYDETVGELLERMKITLNENDKLSVEPERAAEDGMVIRILHYTYGTEQAVESVAYKTERTANASMSKGKEEVKREGKNGSALVTYSVTYENGKEVSREETKREIVEEPVSKLVEYGTKAASVSQSDRVASDNGSGVLTLKSGQTITYSRSINASATAYTARAGAKTASGRVACVGCVAVDPRVIPMGSKLYITTKDGQYSYGVAVAADTGGAIKGNKVDLYFNTYSECVQFGRRSCTVYVLN